MVSVTENLARVKRGVEAYAATLPEDSELINRHARIIRDHGTDMDDNNRRRASRNRSPPSMRFRFKDGNGRHKTRPSKRRRIETFEDDGDRATESRSHRRSESHGEGVDLDSYTAHPLRRPKPPPEYLDPSMKAYTSPSVSASPPPYRPYHPEDREYVKPDDAFRESLFDALADDEGAAAYWEGVYSQPIHTYPRPTLEKESGKLESMTDEEYTEYVKRKMWERKNPHLVQEMRERERKEKEGRRTTREQEEDVREFGGSRRNARGRRSTPFAEPEKQQPGFMADIDEALLRGKKRKLAKRWTVAWDVYSRKWESLTQESAQPLRGTELAKAIPWPVEGGVGRGLTKERVEEFFASAPLDGAGNRVALLKAERFRWHPDKIQHRFGGDNVDGETLKMVTSVFQTIDEMLAIERKKEAI